jgi:hypothetical protein
MKTLLKVFKSPWWDLFPVVPFFAIALEGKGFWIGGVSLIVWLFSMALRHLVK